MELIIGSVVQNLIKFIVFIFVAWAGVILGRKYKDHKQGGLAQASAEKKESK